MTPHDYPMFLDWLTDLAACFTTTPPLDKAAPQYFTDLTPFDVALVQEALRTARQTCRFFPTIAELLARATDVRRARCEATRDRQNKHKLLAYQADAVASGLSPAQNQAQLAELLAVLSDGLGMDAVTPPEPCARPRPLHKDYRIPTVDDAARKCLLRDQVAYVLCMEEAMTST